MVQFKKKPKKAAKKSKAQRPTALTKAQPKSKGITVTSANNGFVISKRDEKWREQVFVAKSEKERDRIVKREMGIT